MKAKLLNAQELNDLEHQLPKWEVKSSRLLRQWEFNDFIAAFGFITKVALLAESMNHHPNLLLKHSLYPKLGLFQISFDVVQFGAHIIRHCAQIHHQGRDNLNQFNINYII